jgi:hypothetical protein
MKKRRRIEITAVRRRTTVVFQREPEQNSTPVPDYQPRQLRPSEGFLELEEVLDDGSVSLECSDAEVSGNDRELAE